LRIEGYVIELFSSDAANCHWGCSGAWGQFAVAEVPEPGSLALLLACLAALLARRAAGGGRSVPSAAQHLDIPPT
jgi:hypothetical protein